MSDHISAEELADAAEGLLAPARADVVRTHVASCPQCLQTADLLSSVTVTLSSQPAPAMPAHVSSRLDAVIAQEQTRRQLDAETSRSTPAVHEPDRAAQPTDRPLDRPADRRTRQTAHLPSADVQGADVQGADVLAWTPRPRLAAPEPAGHHRGRTAGFILAAAAAATLVGFGGYVVSARAGLNEPPSGAAAVSSGDLRTQAGDLERGGDLDPHRFSQAWTCARQVTDGRITGIASVTVDGSPALLVYLDDERVAVVEGCHENTPRVTATAPLTR